MVSLKCKSCGGELEILEESTVCECEYCGLKQTVPVMDDEKKIKLFERANRLRLNCEFDKAAGVYENIVEEFSEEAEGYWGLILCKYGIEYVDDPAGDKVPTCHRSSFDSVMEDKDLELALEYADLVAKRVYREQAKQLEEIRKGIIEVVGKEEPYDIFICYKETDENGDRTIDSVMAQDIYDALTEKGYRVFFSRISLEDKLGVEYEPFIFAALNSAKVMLAVGTDYEYYDAVWVKNEWSRFLKLMVKDKSKHLIPCYKNLDAYDIPKEFAHLQAQDLGKVGAIQDLIRGIEKLIGKKEEDKVTATPVVQQVVSGGPNVEALLKRGYMALEDGEWNSAKDYFDQVLNMDAECGAAYIGIYMAKNNCKNENELHKQIVSFNNLSSKDYKRAKQYATQDMNEKFNKWEQEQADRIKRENEEKERREAEEAEQRRKEAEEKAELERVEAEKKAAEEAEEKRKKEKQKIENERKKKETEERRIVEYNRILSLIEKDDYDLTTDEKCELSAFENDRDSIKDERLELKNKIEQIDKDDRLGKIACEIENKTKCLSSLGVFKISEKKALKNEINQLNIEYDNRRKEISNQKETYELRARALTKKIEDYAVKIQTLNEKYKIRAYYKLCLVSNKQQTMEIVNKLPAVVEEYPQILEHYPYIMIQCPQIIDKCPRIIENNPQIIEQYPQIMEQCPEIIEHYPQIIERRPQVLEKYPEIVERYPEIIRNTPLLYMLYCKKGECIRFGKNYKDLEWLVLEKKDERLLLLSKYAIGRSQYNDKYKMITWEECTLRTWLNESFFSSCFDMLEQSVILYARTRSDISTGSKIHDGVPNKVFLLSIKEAQKYFYSNSERKATLSDGTSVFWWLRSTGRDRTAAADVSRDGSIYSGGSNVILGEGAVRPAIWVDISKVKEVVFNHN